MKKNLIMLLDEYLSTNYNDKKQIITLINDVCKVENNSELGINNIIVRKLLSEGYNRAEVNTENFYMDKYNNLEQLFMLDEDKDHLATILIEHYISSIAVFQKPSNFIHYLSNIYCDRFINNTNIDKITLVKKRETFKDFLKRQNTKNM